MDYFGEKSEQVAPGTLTAFGIKIWSRYGKAWELVEMLSLAQDLAEAGLHGHVREMFYDSKAYICSFELTGDLSNGVNERILNLALERLDQFEFDGVVYHRNGMAEA